MGRPDQTPSRIGYGRLDLASSHLMDMRWMVTKVLVISLLTSRAATENIGHDNPPSPRLFLPLPLNPYVHWISPNPLKIYHKVFVDLATKYSKFSKRVLNQSHTARYPKHPKRSLSNRENWGKRSDTMHKEVEDLMSQQELDNEIFSKRIWLEGKKPEKSSDVQEIPKDADDVTSSRLSPGRRSDLNRIRILHNHGSPMDLFPPLFPKKKTKLSSGQDQQSKMKQENQCIKPGRRGKRRIGMIQNSPIFESKEGDDYRCAILLKNLINKYDVCKILLKLPYRKESSKYCIQKE